MALPAAVQAGELRGFSSPFATVLWLKSQSEEAAKASEKLLLIILHAHSSLF